MRTELTIDRLSKLGEGVSTHEGRTVFVEGALPGERVVAEIVPDGKILRGDLIEILTPSADRREPRCVLAGTCGGCDWLHADERLQREAKLEIVLSALEHLGGIARGELLVHETVVSPKSWGYRRRAVLHTADGALGFFGRKSHARVPVAVCPALSDPLAKLPGELAVHLAPMLKDVISVNLLAEEERVSFAVYVKGEVRERHVAACELAIRGCSLRGAVIVPEKGPLKLLGKPALRSMSPLYPEVPLYLRPDGFVQANADGNAALVAAAMQALAAEPNDRVLELFCGNGNLTFAAAGLAAEVLAVESSGLALELAQRGAQEGHLDNVRFVQGDADKVCQGLIREGRRFERLLLDPPRAGAAQVAQWARGLGVRQVAYVSCDPGSLARDASELKAAGYRPSSVQVVDMFPQTRHVEAVMAFERISR